MEEAAGLKPTPLPRRAQKAASSITEADQGAMAGEGSPVSALAQAPPFLGF